MNQWPAYKRATAMNPVMDPHASADRKTLDGWFVPSMPDLNRKNPYVQNYASKPYLDRVCWN
ncbi:hypothetical protein CS542_01935 [Pedobacter sp. IW39]|nr:hypothetical protein CS542_01935 [Pedobacter sp. IW39]